jgi:hypothetical protein
MSAFISDRFAANHPASLVDIADFVLESLGHALWADTVRHIIMRMPGVKFIDGVPLEAARVGGDPVEIEAYVTEMDMLIEDVPAPMIANLDDTGHCEWIDACRETVVVPVERASKRSSLLGAITADGGHLTPLVIVDRATLQTELFDLGHGRDRGVYPRQENAFITTPSFGDEAGEVLFPDFDETREKLQYDEHTMVLLDGCSAPHGDWFERECLYQAFHCTLLPSHPSDQLQPLDLAIFGIDKSEAARHRPSRGLNPQTIKVIKMVEGDRRVARPNNPTMSVKWGGIVVRWDYRRRSLVANFSHDATIQVRGNPGWAGTKPESALTDKHRGLICWNGPQNLTLGGSAPSILQGHINARHDRTRYFNGTVHRRHDSGRMVSNVPSNHLTIVEGFRPRLYSGINEGFRINSRQGAATLEHQAPGRHHVGSSRFQQHCDSPPPLVSANGRHQVTLIPILRNASKVWKKRY